MKFLTAFFILVFCGNVRANDQPCADINGDGQVDVADFLILTEQFGQATKCAKQKPSIVIVQLDGQASMNWGHVVTETEHPSEPIGSYINEVNLLIYDIDLSNIS